MEVNNLIGFAKEKELIIKLLKNSKIPHAFLLVGKKSIGKSIFAKHLSLHIAENAANTLNKDVDGEKLKRDFLSDSHPDLYILTEEEDKSKISVEQVRDLLHSTSLASYHGLGTFIIIQDAERLSIAAANSLLKSLEEPTPNTYYILTSSAINLIPETILSRTFQINCSDRSREELLTILKSVLDTASIELPQNVLTLLDGSLELLIKDEDFNPKNNLPHDIQKTKLSITQNIQQLIELKSRVENILRISDSLNQKSQLIQFFRTSEKNEYLQNCKIKIFFGTLRDHLLNNSEVKISKLEKFQDILIAYSESQTRNLDIETQIASVF